MIAAAREVQDVLGPPARQPRAHRRTGRVAARLALAVATGAASVLPGFLVGALALQIRSDLDVRVEAVAAGVSVFFIAGALSAGWGGRLADHIGAVRAMRLERARHRGVPARRRAAGRVAARAAARPRPGRRGERRLPAGDQPLRVGADPAGPAGTRLRRQAVGHPVRDPRERPGASRCWRSRSAGGPPSRSARWGRWRSALALPPARVRVHVSRRPASRRPSRALVLTAIGAALATAGPSALGAYLVASAVDVGIAEGTAGLLAAVSSGLSLAMRVMLGARADRRARLRAQHRRRSARRRLARASP